MLAGKTVLITGVGPGLGRELVACAVRDGANVVIGARREANLKAVVEEFGTDRVAYRATDITDGEQVRSLVALAEDRFGGLDALINNAALDSVLGGLLDTTDAQWRAVFEVNVFGTMDLVRASVPLLERAGGAIVFIGSQQWVKPAPDMIQAAYGASKGAVVSATYQLAHELGPRGIRVNAVSPSWMWGPMMQAYVDWQSSARGVPGEQVRAELDAKFPLGFIPEDADVAELATFLVSDRARAITGQSLLVNAGEFMR